MRFAATYEASIIMYVAGPLHSMSVLDVNMLVLINRCQSQYQLRRTPAAGAGKANAPAQVHSVAGAGCLSLEKH